MRVDVVVCAHNEAPRLGPVLGAVIGSPVVGSLIVVADACTDTTATVAAAAGALVIPTGARTKGTAMQVGLSAVETPTVVFIDGDISGLRPEHVTALCTLPPAGGQLVGVRGQLPNGWTVPKAVALWPSISGERRLPTSFVRDLQLAGRGWKVETQLNAAVARAGLPRSQVVLAGVSNPRKTDPVGWLDELVRVAGVTVTNAPQLARYSWGLM